MMLLSRPLLMAVAIVICSAAGFGALVHVVFPNRPPAANAVSPPAAIVSQPPESRSVTWFKAHIPELRAKLVACKDDPGQARNDAECSNAQHAQWDLSFDAFLGKSK
jgi:hypothetical protein